MHLVLRGVCLAALTCALVLSLARSAGAGGLTTALIDPAGLSSADLALSGSEVGVGMIRIQLYWRGVAPWTRPLVFDAENPADPNYNWSSFDAEIKAIRDAGLQPIVSVSYAPDWAEGSGSGADGTVRPNPVEFGKFAKAAATRYSGLFLDPADLTGITFLPRVRYWQAWNEPNRSYYLAPQYVSGKLVAPALYRSMVNQFALGVHSVDGNLVIAGGLAPFGHGGQPAPMAFMRKMLCMSKIPYHRVCSATSNFDVWSAHPYTCGPPSHHALAADDVSMGDLPEMRALLRAGVRWHRVVSTQPVGYWVTEFSWDTNPPDPKAVPLRLHARWVAEALYRMWKTGVGVATWFQLRDQSFPSHYQSGFYFLNGSPKTRSLEAFRFPFVALVRNGRVFVWGRTPPGASHLVTIQRSTSSGWRTVGNLVSGATGVFSHTYAIPRVGSLRAVIPDGAGFETSTPFSVKVPRQPLICPFGK
jgi:hypothetical protein